ncbi:hypothetical protein DFJ73DRAFT_825527 [Zopfochytrium polystomum]|nr:hypothetical protein DFJ73DRAFT_825527 [Zopfochytrium polystomum]
MGPKKKKSAALSQPATAASSNGGDAQKPSTPAPATNPATEPAAASNETIDAGDEDHVPEDNSQATKDMKNMNAGVEVSSGSVNETAIGKAIGFLTKQMKELKESKTSRDKELAKISVSTEDVQVLMAEFDLSKATAERALKENGGGLEATLRKLVAI